MALRRHPPDRVPPGPPLCCASGRCRRVGTTSCSPPSTTHTSSRRSASRRTSRKRNPPQWVRYMRRYLLIISSAVVCYVVYPMAPPWMASRDGYITEDILADHRPRLVRPRQGHQRDCSPERLGRSRNQVAAMPSLHAGLRHLRGVVGHYPAERPPAVAAAALSAGDVVHARLLRRALRHRLPSRARCWCCRSGDGRSARSGRGRRAVPEADSLATEATEANGGDGDRHIRRPSRCSS